MASEVVSIALETVRGLLIEEAKFLGGVSDQVKEVRAELNRMQCFLKDADKMQLKDVKEVRAELNRMQCFLKDADKMQLKDETIRHYVREIRRLAYRTENVLDKFVIEVESRREKRSIGKALKRSACILCEGGALHKVGSEIANITTKINSLTTRLETYGVVQEMRIEGGQSSNQQWLRQTYPHQVEEYFVGMKDDIRQLVSIITNEEDRSHRVISIYGMGGLGKTTLARKIYNHVDVQRGFKAFAWVTITQQFNRRMIFQDILRQLLPDQQKDSVNRMEERELEKNDKVDRMKDRELERKDRVDRMEERELVGELYKVQKETKCLVVLDDLWGIEDWKCLSPAFPFVEVNSKILITTRNQNLAKVEFPYELKFLTEDEGWELLQKRAFIKRDAKDSENDPKLEAIGRKIVRKCGKLPLAISVLGGVLSQKKLLHEWESVNKDVESYLRTSEGSKEGYGAVLQVLALSYDELPYFLKPCFLHLGHFREDEDIEVEMLYLMWIAEGMVSSDHQRSEETLTDVAERYLYEMASRSMVQLKLDEFSTNTRIESCYLHDLMRDFCLARGKEVEFLKLLDLRGGKDPLTNSSADKLDTPARCSIHIEDSESNFPNDNDYIISMALEASGKLRSLLFSCRRFWLRISFPQVIGNSNKLKYLRVLRIEGFNFKDKSLPRGIKKLIYLRFFSLKDCSLNKLPSSIGQLQYLQTLDIRFYSYTVVPNVMWKLKRLRHLYLNARHITRKGKFRFFGLSKLETLIGFDNDIDDLNDVLDLKNLRILQGRVNFSEENDLSKILSYLNTNQHKLRKAQVNVHFREERTIVPLKDFCTCPALHQLAVSSGKLEFQKVVPPVFSSNLSELSLNLCKIEGDPMDFLGKLSNLRRLRFFIVELEDRKVMTCDANAFPKLISLEIENLQNLENWVVAQGSMPNLSHLAISGCEELKMIPDGLRFITTLKELKIEMLTKFTQRIQGVDYDKISHVPLIKIYEY